MVCYAVPPLEVFHEAIENHQRSREPNGLVGKSADLPLAPLGSLLLGVLRGNASEVMVTEKASSWRASAKYCSIGLSASPSWNSGTAYGTISLSAMG